MKRTRIATPGEVVNPEIYEKALRDGLKLEFPKRSTPKAKRNFSPSKLGFGSGQCPRFWHYAFSGDIEHVDNGNHQSQLKRILGTAAHDTVEKLILSQIAEGNESQWEFEKKLSNNDPPIFGFVDIYDAENNVPVELKNVDSSKFLPAKELNSGDSSHVIQTLIYMKLLNAKQGVLLYVDRTTLDTHAFSVVMNDHHEEYVEKLFQWMRRVRESWELGEFPARPAGTEEGKFPCNFCSVQKHCWSDDTEPTNNIVMARGVGY